jgi:hypothetical protein
MPCGNHREFGDGYCIPIPPPSDGSQPQAMSGGFRPYNRTFPVLGLGLDHAVDSTDAHRGARLDRAMKQPEAEIGPTRLGETR